MSDTILDIVKEAVDIGVDADDTYDKRLLLEIEGVVSELSQMTGIDTDVDITKDTKISEILSNPDNQLEKLVSRYIQLSVRLLFDPPTGSVLTSITTTKENTGHRITMHKSQYNYDKR